MLATTREALLLFIVSSASAQMAGDIAELRQARDTISARRKELAKVCS